MEWRLGDFCVSDDPARLDRARVLSRSSLVTRDAHGLYRRFVFKPMADASRDLEIRRADPYGAG